ncbi:hypothetical protein NQZ71_13245 [Niallia taxi]|nr:hypothetical protein NQZ71_13245 [Niallia taxi]
MNLYFQLFKFRLYGQEDEYRFITSITLLRKVTKYSTVEILNLLKLMKKLQVIKLENLSRWDYLLDEQGNVRDKDILVIVATDLPLTVRKEKEVNGKKQQYDEPVDKDNYYIAVSFSMLEYYKELGLNERYYPMYCLISKWSHGYIDGKMNMKIEKMAKCLDFDKDTIHKTIYEMNRKYVLSSHRKTRTAGNGYRFEHYLLTKCNEESIERFLAQQKEHMDRLVKRADKRKTSKQKLNIEEDIDIDSPKESNIPTIVDIEKIQVSKREEDDFYTDIEAIFG